MSRDEDHELTHCVCCDERLPQERQGGSMTCEACDDCERDVGEPCPRMENKRHAENERKARLYDLAMSDLRNAVAEFGKAEAARKAAGDVYFFLRGDAPGFKSASDAYDTALRRVQDEAFRVVGTVDGVLRRGSR
jgi:hypothetical protein